MHLTLSDYRKAISDGIGVAYYSQVASASEYYPFGMLLTEGNYSSGSYRFGFNGQEKDDEIYGTGNSMTAQFWQYDARLGRRWNVDPKWYRLPELSPYSVNNNNPILYIDPEGDFAFFAIPIAVSAGEALIALVTATTVTYVVFDNTDQWQADMAQWNDGWDWQRRQAERNKVLQDALAAELARQYKSMNSTDPLKRPDNSGNENNKGTIIGTIALGLLEIYHNTYTTLEKSKEEIDRKIHKNQQVIKEYEKYACDDCPAKELTIQHIESLKIENEKLTEKSNDYQTAMNELEVLIDLEEVRTGQRIEQDNTKVGSGAGGDF